MLAAMDFSDGFPIGLSLRVAALAMFFATPIGLVLAWIQSRKRYRLHWVVDGVILLPLVLPPSVIGYFLVVVLGRRGAVGSMLESTFGLILFNTQAAAVIAAFIVSLPLLVKTVQPALEAVPRDLERVGSSLGLGPMRLFFRVSLPCAWRGVLAGLVLAFARAIGEFGATLMFAGSSPGRTNTMALEIFDSYRAGEDARALAYVVVLTAISLIVVFAAAMLSPRRRQA